MSRTGKKDAIELRRSQIASLLLGGATQRDIADMLHVSLGTVNGDLQVLRKRWRTEQIDSVEGALLLDLKRVDNALMGITPRVGRGDLLAIDRLVKLLQYRAATIGYSGAVKLSIETHGDDPQFDIRKLDPDEQAVFTRLWCKGCGIEQPGAGASGVGGPAAEKGAGGNAQSAAR